MTEGVSGKADGSSRENEGQEAIDINSLIGRSMGIQVLEGAFVQAFCFLVCYARLAVRPKHRSSITFLVSPHCSFVKPLPHIQHSPLFAPSIYRCCRPNALAKFHLILAPPSLGVRVMNELSYFCEPDIRRFLPEALTADVQPVLANETGWMGAYAAVMI